MEDNLTLLFFIILSVTLFFLLIKKNVKLNVQLKKHEHLSKINSKLMADNALLEAEHLKFQLQPHTLNNILANLKVIANKLNKGMDSLSSTLDYILYKGQTHLVSIEDEMTFIKKYLDLNDLFISEIDAIKIDTTQVDIRSKHYHSACIPHLITAYFIENAFKHGDIYHPEFLKIQLKLSETTFEMSVINRTKNTIRSNAGGIGLQNMRKRLDLLLNEQFDIKTISNENTFHSTLIINF